MNAPRHIRAVWLGTRPYAEIHDLQVCLFEARRRGKVGDTLLLLEHSPVITAGRGARPGHVLAPREVLAAAGLDFVETGRGGDVTLHAPGQLVAYPIFDLRPDWQDVRRYVRALCEVMSRVAAHGGIGAGPLDEYVGLWVDASSPAVWPGQDAVRTPVKLGAVGVRISRWITMHGFALNLNPDLSLFRWIVPCGIRQYGVTSVAELGGVPLPMEKAAARAVEGFTEVFGAHPTRLENWADAERLEQLVAPFERPLRHA